MRFCEILKEKQDFSQNLSALKKHFFNQLSEHFFLKIHNAGVYGQSTLKKMIEKFLLIFIVVNNVDAAVNINMEVLPAKRMARLKSYVNYLHLIWG